MDEAEKEVVRRFLRDFKQIATAGRGIDIVDRLKNMQSLAQLDLTKRNCIATILGLSVEDYCDGPKPDKGRSGEIWEFGQSIEGKEIYIKLKVGKVRLAKCLSFHIAEYLALFPLQGKMKEKGG